tara:strand:+ start:370 stop:846 length:477 start_codon:yes stop_codon:yes gene_type:complete
MLRRKKLSLLSIPAESIKMNDPVSWDPTLVKKFSTSNHYKLLNQLRNEVKKYPLNNKKKSSSIQSKDSNIDNKNNNINKLNDYEKQNSKFSNKSINNNEVNNYKSTVSFNNAKNFSIYNQPINNNIRVNDCSFPDQPNIKDDSSVPTFKERLNQVDMK